VSSKIDFQVFQIFSSVNIFSLIRDAIIYIHVSTKSSHIVDTTDTFYYVSNGYSCLVMVKIFIL